MNSTRLHFQWQDARACRPFRTAVSLHSHTLHSRERLGFLPGYIARLPLLAWEVRRLEQRYHRATGRHFDYARAFWTPPLPPREAFHLERSQIQDRLGLAALVSLTDHNDIEAGSQLQWVEQTRGAPISVEWTLPWGPTCFHVGLHHLPAELARSMLDRLLDYTRCPSPPLLPGLLDWLDSQPHALIVLNHPLWDQTGIGAPAHRQALGDLLRIAGHRLHALELNGLRPWSENRAALEWARASGLPVVSGGDRHGCEPNSILNLTAAASFSEFVSEVRSGGRSEVLVLEHYREPRGLRVLRTIGDILREYPEFPGRAAWTDRILYQPDSAAPLPLSWWWKDQPPALVRGFIRSMHLLVQTRPLQGSRWFASRRPPSDSQDDPCPSRISPSPGV